MEHVGPLEHFYIFTIVEGWTKCRSGGLVGTMSLLERLRTIITKLAFDEANCHRVEFH